jgi:hypothetical protein
MMTQNVCLSWVGKLIKSTWSNLNCIRCKWAKNWIFRKNMRTPVNLILTAIAACDTCVLFSNLIYTTHFTFIAFASKLNIIWVNSFFTDFKRNFYLLGVDQSWSKIHTWKYHLLVSKNWNQTRFFMLRSYSLNIHIKFLIPVHNWLENIKSNIY